MKVDKDYTDCCGEPFYKPGWPDIDICSLCKEHASPLKMDFDDEGTWKEQEEYLNYKERRPEK